MKILPPRKVPVHMIRALHEYSLPSEVLTPVMIMTSFSVFILELLSIYFEKPAFLEVISSVTSSSMRSKPSCACIVESISS